MNIKDRLIQLCRFYDAINIISNIESHNFNLPDIHINIATIFISNERCNNCYISGEDIRKQVMTYFYNRSGEVISCNEKIIKNLLE